MHTNAFKSSTDKEWTRFRGSNVSVHVVEGGSDSDEMFSELIFIDNNNWWSYFCTGSFPAWGGTSLNIDPAAASFATKKTQTATL